MAYSGNPYGKATVQTANDVPFFTSMRAAIPSQAISGIGHEGKESGELFGTIQRNTIRHVFYVRGTPEEVQDSDLLSGMNKGAPHPLSDQGEPYTSMYVIDLRVQYTSFGAPDDVTTGFGQAWTRVTVTYQQRQCLFRPQVSSRIALVAYNEWYFEGPKLDESGAPIPGTIEVRRITGTLDSVPILRPVQVLIYHWDRVELTRDHFNKLDKNAGRLNPADFEGHEKGVWLFDGYQFDLLYLKDPSDGGSVTGFYDITLTFRSDPHRHHEWWTPETTSTNAGARPMRPQPGLSLRDHHKPKQLYRTGQSFDDLVPGKPEIAQCVATQ